MIGFLKYGFFFQSFAEETVSLESPPATAENGQHNLSEIISGESAEDSSKRLFAQRHHGSSGGQVPHGNHGGLPASSSSQMRNGSLTPPFEENGVASPIEGGNAVDKFGHLDSRSLGTSIDSAMVTATNTFAKNRFLSGDHVNANNRDALLRRQLFAIGKKIGLYSTLFENDPKSLIFNLHKIYLDYFPMRHFRQFSKHCDYSHFERRSLQISS